MAFEVILTMILFLVLLAFGLPIAMALLSSGFIGLLMIGNLKMGLASLALVPYATVAKGALIVIPLFVLTGQVAFAAGLSRDAYDMAYRWFGKFKGGLAMASVAASAAFAATSGSSVATAATVGKIAIPEMKRFGYADSLATGCVAAGGTLGILIPPSISFIIYGIITETSIGKLLIAGVVPGIISASIYITGLFLLTRWRPDMAPPGVAFSWAERFRSLFRSFGILALFLIIMGGIYTGLFTPSEASAVGAFTAILLAFMKRATKKALRESFSESAKTSAMIFMLLVGAMVFAQFIAISGVGADIAKVLSEFPAARVWVLILILALYIPMGMFLDGMSVMLITMPVIFPTVVKLGYDPIWFGVIITKMIEIGLITPPVGFNIFIIKGVTPNVPLETIFKGAAFFLILDLITVGVLIAFPDIVTWLPNRVM